jgi:hypothetical protein
MTYSVHVTLAGHPDNPPGFTQQIGATLLQKSDGSLTLAYAIHGVPEALRIPAAIDSRTPAAADALWRATCCELFIATVLTAGYREYNFSPSGQWAIYDFGAYRQPTPAKQDAPVPDIRFTQGPDRLQLDVRLPPGSLPDADTLRCALAVVLEARDGSLGYWALAHPAGQPDFHHPTGFALQLAHLTRP